MNINRVGFGFGISISDLWKSSGRNIKQSPQPVDPRPEPAPAIIKPPVTAIASPPVYLPNEVSPASPPVSWPNNIKGKAYIQPTPEPAQPVTSESPARIAQVPEPQPDPISLAPDVA